MPKIRIKAKTFNGVEINPEVDVFINYGKKDNFLPLFVYNDLKDKIKSKLNRKDLDFEIISKDLDKLKEKKVEIIWEDFKEKILEIVKDIEEIKNPFLNRAINFYEEGKFLEAKEMADNINYEELSQYEKDEYRLLEFMLKNKKSEKEFYEEVDYFQKNPIFLKKLFFHMIKFAQDKRDEKLPRQLISKFEDSFSLKDLNDKEKSIYFYLKGRALYHRGEFIEALRNLIKAKEYAIDEELLANIYNTSANIFTDNLYFDEAIFLANKSLEIRKKLHLDEKVKDTLSLIGGIYLKQNKLNKSYEYFKNIDREDARINNYRAKVAILRGYLNKAKEFIEKSKNIDNEDKKGFRRSIEMLYLFKKGELEKVKEFFSKEFVLPEKREKVDAIVWGAVYTILAEIYFKEEKFEDFLISLYKAIKILLEDNYILEAYYLSLYPYFFDLDKNLIKNFENTLFSLELNSKISDYIYRHSDILKKEANKLVIEIKTDNLREFYKELNQKNIKAFNKYNLL